MQEPTPTGPPPPGWVAPVQKTNTLALVSLVSGILCWLALPVVAAIAAVITGHLARREIRKTGEAGDGLALIGMISGYVHLALAAVVLILVILIFGGLLALLAGTPSH